MEAAADFYTRIFNINFAFINTFDGFVCIVMLGNEATFQTPIRTLNVRF